MADGISHVSDAYTATVGPGYWIPTPPAFAAASTPYWGNLRTMVAGSGDGSQPAAPTTYSEDPSSAFYLMAKHIYDVSQTLTPAEIAMANYWKDIPGVTSPGHLMNILIQINDIEHPALDKAAMSFALSGITDNDAAISCWKTKYSYNLERPITYIRNIMGNTTWNPLFPTPNFPEWTSGHATIAGAVAETLTELFGDNYQVTNHTYDYLGMAPRTYTSFMEMAQEIGMSRVYAGIHYTKSCTEGTIQGIKIARNVNSRLKFLKE